MKEDFLGLTANLSISPKKLDLKRFPQRQASGYLAERKRNLRGIVQSTSVKLLFWNALKNCWPIFTDNGRHVGRLVCPSLPVGICYAWALLPSGLGFARFHLDGKLSTAEKAKGRKLLLKGSDSTAWFCIQVMIMLMIHQPFSLSCAQVVTVLQLIWEFVDIEQRFWSAAVFCHLEAGKSGYYKGFCSSSPKPKLLPLNLMAFLYKYKCIGG